MCARVEVVGVDPAPCLQVTGGASYLSHSDRRLHVVLPAEGGGARLRVRWPAGGVEEAAIPAGTTEITLVEGALARAGAPGEAGR